MASMERDSTATLRTISDYIVELFPEAHDMALTPRTKLADIPGWDSMSAINFQTRVETGFGVTIPEEMLGGQTSVGDVLEQLSG